ncbi:hypothetical protein C8F04DRAFT_378381 [Mycena alexandri]|uniref:Secreted protein n=1 Tax=Mycena alexandri TaxID=1745969 RepID=A0AAD6WP70_9AGAR|nr:hypothetical protein C8F04DRAFT_378381 [Mycena alexandri]
MRTACVVLAALLSSLDINSNIGESSCHSRGTGTALPVIAAGAHQSSHTERKQWKRNEKQRKKRSRNSGHRGIRPAPESNGLPPAAVLIYNESIRGAVNKRKQRWRSNLQNDPSPNRTGCPLLLLRQNTRAMKAGATNATGLLVPTWNSTRIRNKLKGLF